MVDMYAHEPSMENLMSVASSLTSDGRQFTISVSGRFDFRAYESFRSAYSDVSPAGVDFKVNLSEADYMDSSALGMLLLLKEYVGGGARVEIQNSSEDVKNVLKIANFDKLFDIL